MPFFEEVVLADFIGSANAPARVAVIGSGPAGFYACEAFLKQADPRVRVDLFDRLPPPYGRSRGGVRTRGGFGYCPDRQAGQQDIPKPRRNQRRGFPSCSGAFMRPPRYGLPSRIQPWR